jgi:hypothetical protein
LSTSTEQAVTRRIDHEPSSLSAAAAAAMMGGMLFLIVAALLISWIALDGFSNVSAVTRSVTFPKPGVEPNQAFERLEVQQRDQKALWSYGRAEREPGFATIPIDRAMELLKEEHLAGLSASYQPPQSAADTSPPRAPVEAEK